MLGWERVFPGSELRDRGRSRSGHRPSPIGALVDLGRTVVGQEAALAVEAAQEPADEALDDLSRSVVISVVVVSTTRRYSCAGNG